jgi:spore coat polysaccharide biosynthesis predicted glycosyltransferase SpsG
VSSAVVVVADGGPGAGLGHVGRSSAIAAALRARGLEVACHAYGAAAPDAPVVVLDSYTMPEHERAALAARSALAVMHDLGGAPPAARLVVSTAGDDDGDPRVLAGLRYAPLRPPFWGLPARAVRPAVRRILVTTGGGVLQDAGVATAAALKAAHPDVAVAIVRGPYADFDAPPGVELVDAPPTLLGELLAADVVVTAAGRSALEAAATGAANVAMVDNQRRNARALARAGAAGVVEPGEEVAAVRGLDREALAVRAQAAVDGFGALRIAYRVSELLGRRS